MSQHHMPLSLSLSNHITDIGNEQCALTKPITLLHLIIQWRNNSRLLFDKFRQPFVQKTIKQWGRDVVNQHSHFDHHPLPPITTTHGFHHYHSSLPHLNRSVPHRATDRPRMGTLSLVPPRSFQRKRPPRPTSSHQPTPFLRPSSNHGTCHATTHRLPLDTTHPFANHADSPTQKRRTTRTSIAIPTATSVRRKAKVGMGSAGTENGELGV
jgi:hypothetical protein